MHAERNCYSSGLSVRKKWFSRSTKGNRILFARKTVHCSRKMKSSSFSVMLVFKEELLTWGITTCTDLKMFSSHLCATQRLPFSFTGYLKIPQPLMYSVNSLFLYTQLFLISNFISVHYTSKACVYTTGTSKSVVLIIIGFHRFLFHAIQY